MHDDHKGVSELAFVLQRRMKSFRETPPVLDFGSIEGDWSLTTNLFPVRIPQSDFQICRGLALGLAGEPFADVELTGNLEDVTGKALMPERMRSLMPGDRVLVAWIGNEAVVIDIILPATEAG